LGTVSPTLGTVSPTLGCRFIFSMPFSVCKKPVL
jgi:hypothetical protein